MELHIMLTMRHIIEKLQWLATVGKTRHYLDKTYRSNIMLKVYGEKSATSQMNTDHQYQRRCGARTRYCSENRTTD